MAERGSFELHAVRHTWFSKPVQKPFCCYAPSGGRRLVLIRKPFGLTRLRTGAQGRLGSPSIWRRMIGIEPSTLRSPAASNGVGEPTPAFSIWRMTRELNSQPFGRIAFPTRARSLPGISSKLVRQEGFEPITVQFLKLATPTVGLLAQTGAAGRHRTDT